MQDDSMAQIPVMQRPVSLMEHGPNSQNLAAMAQARHPVDQMQRREQQQPSGGVDLDFVRHVYGSGLAMRLTTEQKIAVQQEQASLVPLHHGSNSGSLYREIVTGQDMKLDFADYLSLPEHQPEMPRENLHLAAERKLGL